MIQSVDKHVTIAGVVLTHDILTVCAPVSHLHDESYDLYISDCDEQQMRCGMTEECAWATVHESMQLGLQSIQWLMLLCNMVAAGFGYCIWEVLGRAQAVYQGVSPAAY